MQVLINEILIELTFSIENFSELVENSVEILSKLIEIPCLCNEIEVCLSILYDECIWKNFSAIELFNFGLKANFFQFHSFAFRRTEEN